MVAVPEIDCSCNIVSCCDNNYAKYLGVLITSIKENTNQKIQYWIISNGIDETNKQKLMSLESRNLSISIVDFDGSGLNKLKKTIENRDHLSLSTYIKLFVIDFIPSHVDYLLYLDCDMICKEDISKLFSVEFNENDIIMGV